MKAVAVFFALAIVTFSVAPVMAQDSDLATPLGSVTAQQEAFHALTALQSESEAVMLSLTDQELSKIEGGSGDSCGCDGGGLINVNAPITINAPVTVNLGCGCGE